MRSILERDPLLVEVLVQEKLANNPLLSEIKEVISRVADFKERVRSFYFEVVLSGYNCPECGGRLKMIGQSECACSCGKTFDPTTVFQNSSCCGSNLVRKTFHYACFSCNKTVPSRFLFDEKLFDKAYFQEMMKESRRKAKQKREEIRKLLAESRSGNMQFIEDPDLDSIPGLLNDLNDFIKQSEDMGQYIFEIENNFHIALNE